MKVLAADGISPKGIELLQKEFEVVVKDKLPAEELLEIIGIGKTKVGIFDGDIDNGELEIGQVASLLKGNDIEPVAIVMQRLVLEYEQALASLG